MALAAGSPPDVTRRRLTFQYTALEMIRQYKMRQEIKISESTGQEMKDESVQMDDMNPEYEPMKPDDPIEADEMNVPGPRQCLPKRKITQSYINQQALIYGKLCEDLQKLIENSKSNAQNSSGAANKNEGAGEAVTQGGTEPMQITGCSAENAGTKDPTRATSFEHWWNDTSKVESVMEYCREIVISHTILWNFKNEVLRVLLGGTGVIVKALIASNSTDIQILTGLGEMLFKLLLDHISWVYEGNGGLSILLTPRLPEILKNMALFIVQARTASDEFFDQFISDNTCDAVSRMMNDRWYYNAVKSFIEDICFGIQIIAIEQVNCLIFEKPLTISV